MYNMQNCYADLLYRIDMHKYYAEVTCRTVMQICYTELTCTNIMLNRYAESLPSVSLISREGKENLHGSLYEVQRQTMSHTMECVFHINMIFSENLIEDVADRFRQTGTTCEIYRINLVGRII